MKGTSQWSNEKAGEDVHKHIVYGIYWQQLQGPYKNRPQGAATVLHSEGMPTKSHHYDASKFPSNHG